MTTNFTQCVLRRGKYQMVSWIPSGFAQAGRYLKLKQAKQWQDGWLVVSTGSTVAANYLAQYADDWRRTRKASDI